MSINKIQMLIDKEVEKTTKSIMSSNKYLTKTNQELRKELDNKNQLIEDLQKGDLFSKYTKNINESNIGQFLTFIFDTIDNPCSNQEVTKAPEWFYNIVKYWSNKELLLKIYDMLGIKYNKWVLTAKMPYEWGQKECDLFISYLGNHYVCNGAIYDNNLGYWLGVYQHRTIQENITKQYSEIPWQLVLKNPLWTEGDNFDKIIKVVNDNNNGRHFIPIYQYQNLSSQQFEKLASKLLENRNLESNASYTEKSHFSTIMNSIPLDSEVWEKYYCSDIKNKFYEIKLPDKYKKKEISRESNSLNKLTKMQTSGLFTKEEMDNVYNNINYAN